MKKLLFCTITLLSFLSCSKDDDTPSLDNRLVGTKWQTRDTVYEVFFGGVAYDVYEFISTTEVEQYTTKNGSVVESDGTFSYTLNYPLLTIIIDEKTIYEFEFKDSRTIVRKGRDEFMPYMKYLKQ